MSLGQYQFAAGTRPLSLDPAAVLAPYLQMAVLPPCLPLHVKGAAATLCAQKQTVKGLGLTGQEADPCFLATLSPCPDTGGGGGGPGYEYEEEEEEEGGRTTRSMMMWGGLLILVVVGGYVVYRTTRKKRAA